MWDKNVYLYHPGMTYDVDENVEKSSYHRLFMYVTSRTDIVTYVIAQLDVPKKAFKRWKLYQNISRKHISHPKRLTLSYNENTFDWYCISTALKRS